MKEYKKSKTIYIAPIFFIVLCFVSSILFAIYLRDNGIKTIILGTIWGILIGIFFLIYLIILLIEPKEKFSIGKDGIYFNDEKILWKEIDHAYAKMEFPNIYYPSVVIVLKNQTGLRFKHVENPHAVAREINMKYLKIQVKK